MCAFSPSSRRCGEEARPAALPGTRRKVGPDALTRSRFDFDAAPIEPPQETADARARRLAVDPLRNVALEASAGTGKTRVLVDRYVRPARSRRGAAQHPGDHLHPQGRGGNASARDGDAAPAPPRGRHRRRRAGGRFATRSTTSPSARSTRSACRCCTSFRSKPASIPVSTSPMKPKRRDSSKRRSTARLRSAAASRSTMPMWRCSSPSWASRGCARR